LNKWNKVIKLCDDKCFDIEVLGRLGLMDVAVVEILGKHDRESISPVINKAKFLPFASDYTLIHRFKQHIYTTS
jgi:hypothetical protein